MMSSFRSSLLFATLVVLGNGCFQSSGPNSRGLAFCDAQSSCAPGCVAIDANSDGCADRCEAPSCETLAPVFCAGAMPIDADGDGCARECPTGGAICGGLLGSICGPGEFCDFALDARCGAGDQTGVCRTLPDACTELYQPVCGCDGRSYGNECTAHGAGVAVAHWGPCETSICPAIAILCPVNSFPVDSDGDGCVDGCQPVVCPAYVPDCGGATPIDANGDGCALECPGAPISCGGLTPSGPATCPAGMFCDYEPGAICGAADAPGTCQTIPQACALDYSPVCGCDGVTYGNDCEAATHGVGVLHLGICENTCTAVGCPNGSLPFDTDGDGCDDTCHAACGGIAGIGCGQGETCYFPIGTNCGAADRFGYCAVAPTACIALYSPVCGCDGRTYGNSCEASAAGASIQHDGECVTICPLLYPDCGPSGTPVDTDGDGCVDACPVP